MERHSFFDLLLHSNDELARLLNSQVTSRETIHEWPLSCVQRILLENGHRLIYKSESGPTVEPEFYAQARSPLLVSEQTLFRDERYACLILEDVQAPLLQECIQSPQMAVEVSDVLLEQIGQIKGSPPIFLDLSSWESWLAVMGGMLEDLHGLVSSGKYQSVSGREIASIARCVYANPVKEAYKTSVGLVHHDLSGDNVFVLPDGYIVIDWQRPCLGPTGIDRVLLLSSLGIDPRPYVPQGVAWMASLLRIHWVTECSLAWFPPGVKTYDQITANIAQKLN